MGVYQCPVCHQKIRRDLILFLNHAKLHIVEEIKKQHPEWIETSGVCKRCVDYYEEQIGRKWNIKGSRLKSRSDEINES